MTSIDKNELLELKILKHVEETPELNNRMAASKLGCSVKLAHALLGKMVDRGLLHVKKLHSRRWDYFLTPKGITEKARLTYEFLDFSMTFYQEARKASSLVCRQLAESGIKTVAFIGAGDLAEIVYLGVKEWGLELIEVYDGDCSTEFLGHPILPSKELLTSKAAAIVVCIYDSTSPMGLNYLPDDIPKTKNMYWVFDNTDFNTTKSESSPSSVETNIDLTPTKRQINKINESLTPSERIDKFIQLQKNAFKYMSDEGYQKYLRRNMKQRAIEI